MPAEGGMHIQRTPEAPNFEAYKQALRDGFTFLTALEKGETPTSLDARSFAEAAIATAQEELRILSLRELESSDVASKLYHSIEWYDRFRAKNHPWILRNHYSPSDYSEVLQELDNVAAQAQRLYAQKLSEVAESMKASPRDESYMRKRATLLQVAQEYS